MLALFIALLHGVPSILGAFIARERGIWAGAVLSLLGAFVWGRSFFLYADLMGICAGVLAGYFIMTKRDEARHS